MTKIASRGSCLKGKGSQTGKDCLPTWADGVKVADRRDRTRNLSLRKRCTNHLHCGTPHIYESNPTYSTIKNDQRLEMHPFTSRVVARSQAEEVSLI